MTYDEFVNDPYYIGIVDGDEMGTDKSMWMLYNIHEHYNYFRRLPLDIVVAGANDEASRNMLLRLQEKAIKSEWYCMGIGSAFNTGNASIAKSVLFHPYDKARRCNGMNLVGAACREVHKDEVNNMISRFNSRFIVSGLAKSVFGVFEV